MGIQQLTQLHELFNVSNALINCETITMVAEKAIRIAQGKVSSQTASVFLFSKEGFLKRFRVCGTDAEGNPINNSWFEDEKHIPGKSFTGRAVVPKDHSKYGSPQWSNTLSKDQIDLVSRSNYQKKLGALYCAVAVPLNGQHRTFGVLEVINKTNESGKPIDSAFSEDDIYWLSIIGMNLATAISRLRSQNEFKMLAEMSKMLVEPFSYEARVSFDPRPFYQRTVDKLVSPKTCYKACFLRTVTTDESLELVAKAGDHVSWSGVHGETIKLHEHISKGAGFAGKVYATGEPIIIRNLEEKITEFENENWIRANNLKSYACIPLLVKHKVVGALSVYTGFSHNYEQSDIDFLNNIAFLIAAFTESLRVIDELGRTIDELDESRQQLHDDFQKILDAARNVGYDGLVDDVTHVYKNELRKLLRALEEYATGSPGKKDEIIRTQINVIKSRIGQIEKEFSTTSYARVNVNDLVKEVVRYFQLDLKRKPFTISTNYCPQLPDILAKEGEIREVIRNLIDNAVKAILKAKRKQGVITVSTDLITERHVDYIQITVEDNGLGIRKEDEDIIYERGYSTYEGGTGMGLFIVRKVVNSYGGKIEFNSTVGRGSEFIVKIPLKRHLA